MNPLGLPSWEALGRPRRFILDHRLLLLQFYGVRQSKIWWTIVEIKFIKGKRLNKNCEAQNQKFGTKKFSALHA